MSEEKNLEEFELSDDAIESAAGGLSGAYYYASFTCNNCGGNAVFKRKGNKHCWGNFTHDCGETYYIDFSSGKTEDSKKQGVANLTMYY